jgi:hypothetical protein
MTEDATLQVQDTEKREVAETGAERTRDRLAFVPRADVYETDDEIVVVADMPGVDANSVDITLEENVLTINGYVEPEPPEGHGLAYEPLPCRTRSTATALRRRSRMECYGCACRRPKQPKCARFPSRQDR